MLVPDFAQAGTDQVASRARTDPQAADSIKQLDDLDMLNLNDPAMIDLLTKKPKIVVPNESACKHGACGANVANELVRGRGGRVPRHRRGPAAGIVGGAGAGGHRAAAIRRGRRNGSPHPELVEPPVPLVPNGSGKASAASRRHRCGR